MAASSSTFSLQDLGVQATRHADYGQRWGEGAARCFSIDCDFLDDALGLRLMPVPDSFFCPISSAIMNDPVATVDGCSYEREYIERWFRERRQFRQPITSPTTGLELQSTTLMPLMALQRAIEAYLLHRPELKRDHLAGRSFEEAAQVLQIDLLEKQASSASVHEELVRLREANRALKRALSETQIACKRALDELECSRVYVRQLEEDKLAAGGDGKVFTAAGASSGESDAPSFPEKPSPVRSPEPVKPLAGMPVSPRGISNQVQSLPPVVPKAEAQRQRERATGSREADASKAKTSKQGVNHSRRVHLCAQMLLVAALLALCLLLHFRNPLGLSLKALGPVDGGAQPGRAEGERVSNSRISRLIEQMQSRSSDERRIAAVTVREMAASGDEDLSAIFKEGAVTPLVKLLEDSSFKVQEAGASAIGALAASSRDRQAGVARAGAIAPLVQLLRSGNIDFAPKAAASALRHLAAGSDKNQVAIAGAGAIAPLVDIMRSDAPSARIEAAETLRFLAGEGVEVNRYGKQMAIANAGAIVPLVRLIRDETPGTRQAAAGTLRMLATNNADNQVAIAHAGAIDPLVKMLSDAEPGVRLEAAAALDHLSVSALDHLAVDANFGNQVAIGQTGAITELARLLQDQVPEVTFAAVGALRSLAAGNADNLERVVQAGCIPALVVLLKSDSIPVPAVSLIRNLASSNEDHQAALAQAGAIAPMMQLLQHKAPLIRGEVAGGLMSLARSSSLDELQHIQATIHQAGMSAELLKGG